MDLLKFSLYFTIIIYFTYFFSNLIDHKIVIITSGSAALFLVLLVITDLTSDFSTTSPSSFYVSAVLLPCCYGIAILYIHLIYDYNLFLCVLYFFNLPCILPLLFADCNWGISSCLKLRVALKHVHHIQILTI